MHQGPPLVGHVDAFTSSVICGWAHNPHKPDQRVRIHIVIGGRIVGAVSAEHFRADLAAAQIGNGWKAFYFDPRRFLLGENQQVRVAYAANGETLPNGVGHLSRSRVSSTPDWDQPTTEQEPTPARLARHARALWPTIRISLPVDESSHPALERTLASILSQSYQRWELHLSPRDPVAPIIAGPLTKLAAMDPRVTLMNGQAAQPLPSTGSYLAQLEAGDTLEPEALAEFACGLLDHPEVDAVYSDHDVRDEAGEVIHSHHKPAWSPVFFLGTRYPGTFTVVKSSLAAVFAQIPAVDPASGLMARLVTASASNILHLPRILWHQAEIKPPAAQADVSGQDSPARPDPGDRAKTSTGFPCLVQWRPPPAPRLPKVSVIIPTRDAPELIEPCLKSVFARTDYPDFEVMVADNETANPTALQILASFPIKRVNVASPFNFSDVNNRCAQAAQGEILVFLNNDTEVLSPDWLQVMVAHLLLPQVGVVGPLLLYPDGTVQHAGMVLGFRGTADHVMRGFPADCDGYRGSLACSREVSAVTGACLMIRRELFLELGGFDERYRLVYQDVDLCLRARRRGLSVLFAANARLTHHESATRGPEYDEADRRLFTELCANELARGDPFYNPNFTRNRTDYCLRGFVP